WILDRDVVDEDVIAGDNHDLVGDPLSIDTVGDLNRAVIEGEKTSLDREFDRIPAMRLLDCDALLPGEAGATEHHPAIDADRHQANTPVPSGMAGRLADEVHVDALETVGLIVPGEGDREGMRV